MTPHLSCDLSLTAFLSVITSRVECLVHVVEMKKKIKGLRPLCRIDHQPNFNLHKWWAWSSKICDAEGSTTEDQTQRRYLTAYLVGICVLTTSITGGGAYIGYAAMANPVAE
jgi:hypothetical protein